MEQIFLLCLKLYPARSFADKILDFINVNHILKSGEEIVHEEMNVGCLIWKNTKSWELFQARIPTYLELTGSLPESIS